MTTKKTNIDLTVCLGQSLFEGHGLAAFEKILHEEAAQWSNDLHIWREGDRPARREIHNFPDDVRAAALERGEVYKRMVEQHGTGENTRRFGNVELRGGDKTLIVVIGLDDLLFSPSAGRYLWGNTISLQFEVENKRAEWAARKLQMVSKRIASELPVWYMRGHLQQEWHEKNISREGGGVMGIGGDASRYLPGIYWLNFYGAPYIELMGMDRLLSAPAFENKALHDGTLVLLSELPTSWNSPSYSQAEQKFLDHVGKEFFFSRNDLHRKTLAPDFGLPPLPRHPRFS